MITIFASPKPFTNPHIAVIQRNALKSWTLLEPRPEIILLGNETGVAEAARELGLRHIPGVAVNEFGTPMLDDLFAQAQSAASHQVLAYVNADIILMNDFPRAVERLFAWRSRALIIGGRYDLDVTGPLDFSSGWDKRLQERARSEGKVMARGTDYFVFPRGLFGRMPPFVLGRTTWDNWLLWRARSTGSPMVSATQAILAVHQNHASQADWRAICEGPEGRRNRSLASHWACSFTTLDATHELVNGQVLGRGWKWRRRRLEVVLHLARYHVRPYAQVMGITPSNLKRLLQRS